MPKRKGVKKNLDNGANLQEENFPSSSSFSMRLRSSKRQCQWTGGEATTEEPAEKKRKIVDSSNSVKERNLEASPCPGQGQGSEVKEVLLNDFPPEMLMEVLKCVDTRTLFACQQVNQKWNSISSDILHHRPDAKLSFTFCNGNVLPARRTSTGIQIPCNFLKLFKKSKNCPVARFHFRDATSSSSSSRPNFWDSKDLNKFLAHFALDSSTSTSTSKRARSTIKIKCLKFDFWFEPYEDYTDSFLFINEKLRDLLLHKIPNLEEFGLAFSGRQFSEPQVRFFPVAANQTTYKNPVLVQFQLPHLKTIYFERDMFQRFPGIYKDLVNAAVNLKNIHFNHHAEFTVEEIQFLFSMRKPYLVKNILIKITDQFLYALKQQQQSNGDFPVPVPVLKFEKMEVNMEKMDPDSATFIQNLYESSKDTLLELSLWPLGTSHRLELPTFRNLRRLTLEQGHWDPWGQRSSNQMFPVGVRSMDIFPVVNTLDFVRLDWSVAFPQQDSIPILPRVVTLCVRPNQCMFWEKSIPVISLMCPNLKHLKILNRRRLYGAYTGNLELLPVARAIWTDMRQIESLEIEVDLDLPANNSAALDSCFTGISLKECQRLAEAKNFHILEKCGNRTEIPQSKLTAERKHASILDMKDLKKLTIYSCWDWSKRERKELHEMGTWISQEFAFKFMPHLTIKQE